MSAVKTPEDLRQHIETWLEQEPGPVLTKEYQEGRLHAFAEVLGEFVASL